MLPRATTAPMTESPRSRTALVLAGGGARGAYEAGVLAHVFEHVLPRLARRMRSTSLSGTSVGAIHAAYTAATAHLPGAERARQLVALWLRCAPTRCSGSPPRDCSACRCARSDLSGGARPSGTVGGLVDLAPLERLVARAHSVDALPENLRGRRGRALCVSCTEVRQRARHGVHGRAARRSAPWRYDPNASDRRPSSPHATCAPPRRSRSCFPPSASATLLRRRRPAHEHAAVARAAAGAPTACSWWRSSTRPEPAAGAADYPDEVDHAAALPARQGARRAARSTSSSSSCSASS